MKPVKKKIEGLICKILGHKQVRGNFGMTRDGHLNGWCPRCENNVDFCHPKTLLEERTEDE